jgi:hypothetical protein
MATECHEDFPQPKWNQAALWTGAEFFGLLRLLGKNRWRVRPSHLPLCLLDLMFALAHTSLRGIQSLLLGSRVKRVQLDPDPLFIVGHWRTGTTLVHELLALDPRHNFPTTFQCFVPNHFLLSERFLKRWTGFTLPANRPPDKMKMAWDLPQEDEFAICNLGVPSPYATIAFPNHPPQNQEYLELDTLSPPQLTRWKKTFLRFLKQLRYKRVGRIVLKSPTHTFRLPVLLELFPQAKFVYMVREPVAVFMSTVRLWKSLYVAHAYQKPDFRGVEQYVFATFTRMHQRWMETRQLVPPGNLVEVRFEDLLGDVSGQLESIYERLDLGPFEPVKPAVENYLAEHADYRANRYEAGAELKQEIYRQWKPYFDEYGYAAPT